MLGTIFKSCTFEECAGKIISALLAFIFIVGMIKIAVILANLYDYLHDWWLIWRIWRNKK